MTQKILFRSSKLIGFSILLVQFSLSFLVLTSCQNSSAGVSIVTPKIVIPKPDFPEGFNLVAHRGFSSVYPQNTISACLRAIDAGADMVELDLCVTKDSQIVVSHEMYLSSDYVNKPDGTPVLKSEESQFIIYQMTYEEVKGFDVGTRTKDHPKTRKLYPEIKPLLKDLIEACERYSKNTNKKPLTYLLEIKSSPKPLGKWQPESSALYCSLINDVLKAVPSSKAIVISFDANIVTTWRKFRESGVFENVPLGYYVSDSTFTAEDHIKKLGFQPDLFSPSYNYSGLERDIVYCKSQNIRIIPWTINSLSHMRMVRSLNPDGLITDFPDVFRKYITN